VTSRNLDAAVHVQMVKRKIKERRGNHSQSFTSIPASIIPSGRPTGVLGAEAAIPAQADPFCAEVPVVGAEHCPTCRLSPDSTPPAPCPDIYSRKRFGFTAGHPSVPPQQIDNLPHVLGLLRSATSKASGVSTTGSSSTRGRRRPALPGWKQTSLQSTTSIPLL